MISLKGDTLAFTFPEIHPEARMNITFMRTFRIPDDGKAYPLPPGFGCFPVRHVDDHPTTVPEEWLEHGGVMVPMYQSEAMWIYFGGCSYPCAVKIAAGKIDAVSGGAWKNGLSEHPQNYLVVPQQPWLDGYCVEKGYIRQFVAMPLGSGYSAEEQVTGKAEHGGLQIAVYPMKLDAYERQAREPELFAEQEDNLWRCRCQTSMGLAPGGRMRQEVYEDSYGIQDWDQSTMSRCFVHIANSLVWRSITKENPPTVPLTASEYAKAGLPWFDYYDDKSLALDGSQVLAGLKSVAEMAEEKGTPALPENESVNPGHVIHLRKGLAVGQVRESTF